MALTLTTDERNWSDERAVERFGPKTRSAPRWFWCSPTARHTRRSSPLQRRREAIRWKYA